MINLSNFHVGNLQDYLNSLYKDLRQYDLVAFWEDVCRDFTVKELLLSSTSSLLTEPRHRRNKARLAESASGSDRLTALLSKAQTEIEKRDEIGLFSCGRKNGTHELAGQRVLQVATIIRNLSFEEDNIRVLARNVTCLRFCLLCASSEWCNLNQMGFDILGNIAGDIMIEEPLATDTCVKEVLLSTLTACISSDDRFQVISSLDILNKLCLTESNEDVIESVLSERRSRVYDQLVNYLSLHDIHLLISTLECLYSLSCLGESTCNSIVRTHGAVEALVSLVTVEAQSYGPKACILMRVVETVPGASAAQAVAAAQPQPPVQQSQPVTQPQTPQQPQAAVLRPPLPVSPVVTTTSNPGTTIVRGQIVQIQRPQLPQNPLPMSPAAQPQPQIRKVLPVTSSSSVQVQNQQRSLIVTNANGQTQQLIIAGSNQQIALNKSGGLVIATTNSSQATPTTQAPPRSQQPQQPPQPQQQQVQLRVSNDEANRQICLSWLKATYETVNGCSIEQQVMYKQYLASLHKLGRKDVISAQHYAVCVRYPKVEIFKLVQFSHELHSNCRTLFGGSVGPNRKQMPDGAIQYHYDGIQVRKVPLPFRVPPQLQQTQPQSQPAAVKPVSTLPPQPQANQARPVQLPSMPVTTVATTTTSPGSPILTHLLHRKNEAPSIELKVISSSFPKRFCAINQIFKL